MVLENNGFGCIGYPRKDASQNDLSTSPVRESKTDTKTHLESYSQIFYTALLFLS